MNIDNILTAELTTDPWEYISVDNLLDQNDFKNLQEQSALINQQCSTNGQTANIWPCTALEYGMSQEVVDSMINNANQLLDHVDLITAKFSNYTQSTSGYFAIPRLAVTGPNFKYPIHVDSIFRALTVVMYISEGDYRGTMIYTGPNESDYHSDMLWKPNRAFITCPVSADDGTWHTWENKSTVPRVTVNISCFRIESFHMAMDDLLSKQDKDKVLSWLLEEFNKGNLIRNVHSEVVVD
jgi:hypothetical protein